MTDQEAKTIGEVMDSLVEAKSIIKGASVKLAKLDMLMPYDIFFTIGEASGILGKAWDQVGKVLTHGPRRY
jgi:hypothetical protein